MNIGVQIFQSPTELYQSTARAPDSRFDVPYFNRLHAHLHVHVYVWLLKIYLSMATMQKTK